MQFAAGSALAVRVGGHPLPGSQPKVDSDGLAVFSVPLGTTSVTVDGIPAKVVGAVSP